VMRAVWGVSRKLRCRDVVLTLLVPGHLVDPRQVIIYQSLCAIRHHMKRHPELVYIMRRCWEACVVEGRSAPGPIGVVYRHIMKLGWEWPEFDHWHRPGRRALPLLNGPDSWWKHELRDGIRVSIWTATAARRNDMQGLEARQGIDRGATLALLGTKLSASEVGLLRSILAGSVRLQKRLHDAKIVVSPTCPFCQLCDETVRHCVWECPHWRTVRATFDLPAPCVQAAWPACTKDCGILIEDERVLTLNQQFHEEAAASPDLDTLFELTKCREKALANSTADVEQTIWTDGACSSNQDCRFRRAGSGIFYGDAHPMNLSAAVPGYLQSNQRAELLAVVLACLRDPRPLDIRSDSEYVCKGFDTRACWAQSGWPGDHADLWDLLAKELSTRMFRVSICWVKGHAKRIDIERGRATVQDKWGNDGADALAVSGAQMHRVPDDIVQSARQRKSSAKVVQSMMVAVLQARFHAEQAQTTVIADRGSDCEDFDAESCNESGNEFISDNEPCTELDDEFDRERSIQSDGL
jgi:ribonuclease HI